MSFWTDGAPIPLRDPQGTVDRTLRESMAPRLLEVLQTNESYKEALRPVFEIAHVYRREGKAYGEKNVLAIAAPGDPLGVKGLVQTVLGELGIGLDLQPASLGFLEPGSAAEIRIGGAVAGYLGQAGAALSGLRATASVAEIDFDAVVKAAQLTLPYKDFNRQPPVDRDLFRTQHHVRMRFDNPQGVRLIVLTADRQQNSAAVQIEQRALQILISRTRVFAAYLDALDAFFAGQPAPQRIVEVGHQNLADRTRDGVHKPQPLIRQVPDTPGGDGQARRQPFHRVMPIVTPVARD